MKSRMPLGEGTDGYRARLLFREGKWRGLGESAGAEAGQRRRVLDAAPPALSGHVL